MLLLMLLFCLCTKFWNRSKVNYVFIFEFDNRDHLDWRQLSEIPCLLYAFLGFFLWLNFERFETSAMYTYYFVILLTLTALVIFCPLPILYWRARAWFLNACWRLFWSGLYPIEFRDFFLGDMFCSTTYSMGNIELFFCLYARDWDDPPMCNSSHSRLLGFFTALPSVWRALQCIRRFRDTRNIFPHLVNCGKYTCSILFYMTLSLYRIDRSEPLFALFILFACINSIYCSVWDVVMDWSLLDPTAAKPFLRDNLAYKQYWLYYLAIFIDPILRFNWIFYAIYGNELQHSAILSFIVSLSEVFRRGLWTIFRVENEHCTNVGRFRASRDIPLPFECRDYTPAVIESGHANSHATHPNPLTSTTSPGMPSLHAYTTGSSVTRPSPSLRLRKGESPMVRTLSIVGAALHGAHAQDFERRKKDDVSNVEHDSSDDEAEEVMHRAADIDEEDEVDGLPSAERETENGNGNGNSK